jgi:hypothetical protein
MRKYKVYGVIHGIKYMGEYKTETPEDARLIAAKKKGSVKLCRRCSAECEEPEIVNIIVEEVPSEDNS